MNMKKASADGGKTFCSAAELIAACEGDIEYIGYYMEGDAFSLTMAALSGSPFSLEQLVNKYLEYAENDLILTAPAATERGENHE